MYSESGYVLISVCSVMRATSKRLCFMASMARSKSTLSGCFDPTLARGLTDFLLVQATVKASSKARNKTKELRRTIQHLNPENPPFDHHDSRRARPGCALCPLQGSAACRVQ